MEQTTPKWVWQEYGTPWRGPAVYHVTASCPNHEPRLGELVVPTDSEGKRLFLEACANRNNLGFAICECIEKLPDFYPELKIIAKQVMPDHVHFVLQVTAEMKRSIREVMRGWVQGCNKEARLRGLPTPVFAERPFLRPLTHGRQLQAMIDYVHDNPRRAALRRYKAGYFFVQNKVAFAGQEYAAVGNVTLLYAPRIETVHVRKELVWMAEQGHTEPLRDYMNGCVLAAREGAVSVSPFISPKETMVRDVLIKEGSPIIYLRDNGFPPGNIYKPSGQLFDLCAAGKLLMLAPWPYNPLRENRTKHLDGHITIARTECQALNRLADSIATSNRLRA